MGKLPLGMKSLGKDPEYDASVRAKLKGSGSDVRKRAQKLRRLKEMSDEQLEKKGFDIIKDSDKFDFEILSVIKELLQRPLSDRTKVELLGKMVQTRQVVWGNINKNINLNIDVTANKIIERLKSFKIQEIQEKEQKNILKIVDNKNGI